jgi:hypothetical protein
MKSKIILLLVASAIITLSFSFIGNNSTKKENVGTSNTVANTENEAPLGGFVSER